MRAVPVFVVLLVARAVAAQALCETLTSTDAQEKCKARLAAECTMTEYWPKRHCEEAIVESLDVCGSEEFVKACEVAVRGYWDICNKPDGDFNDPEGMKAFLDRQAQVPAVAKTWQDFHATYSACYRKNEKCIASDQHHNECQKAADAYAATFKKELDFILETKVNNERSTIQMFVSEGNWANAHGFANNLLTSLREFARFAPDSAALKAEITKLEAEMKGYEKKATEALAKVRCPAEVAPNPALRAKLRPIFAKWIEDSNDDMDEATVAFRMNGKPTTSYVKLTKTTYEDAPVIACVKQTPKDTGKSKCRVFKATMRREKVGNGAFSDWQYYSIGGGDEMLCQNLKGD